MSENLKEELQINGYDNATVMVGSKELLIDITQVQREKGLILTIEVR